MTPTHLVLMDIDGTLLHGNGAGRSAMKAALLEVFGTAGGIDTYHFGGSTDRETVFRLMREANMPDDIIEARFLQLPALMERHILRAKNIQALQGTYALMENLSHHPDALLGVVTGNFKESGFAKLIGAGFDPNIFQVGAYGDLSANRSDLPPAAVEKAYQLTGHHYTGEQIVIIGDTVKDVVCGRSVGARVITVLTGYASHEALEAENPYAIINDLNDTNAVLDLIFQR